MRLLLDGAVLGGDMTRRGSITWVVWVLLAATLWMPAVGDDGAATDAKDTLDPFSIPWEDREIFRSGLVPAEQGLLEDLPGATVYHIAFEVSPDYLRLDGEAEVLYTNREMVSLEEIYFRLYPNAAGGLMSVSFMTVDGEPVTPSHDIDSSILRVPMSEPLRREEHVVIRFSFDVRVPPAYVGWGPFGYVNGILSLDQLCPVIPVYDEIGWNVEPVPPHGDWSYYDASFYLVRATAPSGLVLVAGGVEIGSTDDGEKRTRMFAAGPVRDFYMAGSEDFRAVRGIHDDVTITHYVLSGQEDQAETGVDVAMKVLDAFETRFGDYPYTELDFVTSFLFAGSAMEYPGIVAMSPGMYDPDAIIWGHLPSVVAMEVAIAHEMAHQWVYNIVGSDQVDEPWLDEALAQYFTYLYHEDTYGPREAAGYRQDWTQRWQSVNLAEIPIGLSTFEYERGVYSPIIYGRGPLFLEELGRFLDLDSFLSDYVESHKWGIATTASFARLAGEHSEFDLTDLFDAWVYPGN